MSEEVVRDAIMELRALCIEMNRLIKQKVELENMLTNYIRDNLGWKKVLEEQLIENNVSLSVLEKINANNYKEAVEQLNKMDEIGLVIEPLSNPYSWLKDKILMNKSELSNRFSRIRGLWKEIKLQERRIEREIDKFLQNFPYEPIRELYTGYLTRIRGIGTKLAAQIIAFVYPITNYKYPSKLQAKAGITGRHVRMVCEKGHHVIATSEREKCIYPLKKGKKGERCGAKIVKMWVVNKPPKKEKGWFVSIDFNLKGIFMQCALCFEKQQPNRSFYRYLYDKAKEYYLNRDKGKITRQHARMRALLWTAHKFIAHLWEVWMRLEGYDNIPEPYPIAKLGHTKIFPMTDLPSPYCPQFMGVLDFEPKVNSS